MAYQVSLLQFEGPVDLLLQLIERSELEITQISISHITGQYLDYLNHLEDIEPEELGEFLHLAAKLLVIKSWSLLPSQPENASLEEEREALAHQLEQYKHYQKATQLLTELLSEGRRSWTRDSKYMLPPDKLPEPELDADLLKTTFETLLNRLPQTSSLEIEEMLSVEEALEQICARLNLEENLSLANLLASAKKKQDVITFFLALLELSRKGLAVLTQAQLHDDIMVMKV